MVSHAESKGHTLSLPDHILSYTMCNDTRNYLTSWCHEKSYNCVTLEKIEVDIHQHPEFMQQFCHVMRSKIIHASQHNEPQVMLSSIYKKIDQIGLPSQVKTLLHKEKVYTFRDAFEKRKIIERNIPEISSLFDSMHYDISVNPAIINQDQPLISPQADHSRRLMATSNQEVSHLQAANLDYQPTPGSVLLRARTLYDPEEENNPNIKWVLDQQLNYLLSFIPYSPSARQFSDRFQGYIFRVQRALGIDNSPTIRDVVSVQRSKLVSLDSDLNDFLIECYCQVKEFSDQNLLISSMVDQMKAAGFSDSQKDTCFNSKLYTIGAALKQKTQFGSLFGQESGASLLRILNNYLTESLIKGDITAEYLDFFKVDLWAKYEFQINQLCQPLIMMFCEQKTRDLFSQEDYDNNVTKSPYKSVLDKLNTISNVPIPYNHNRDSITISTFFKQFGVFVMTYQISPNNSQGRVKVHLDQLKAFMNDEIQGPSAHAVMYRVAAELIKVRLGEEGLYQTVKYDRYRDFLLDSRIQLLIPDAQADQQGFLKEMDSQTYKLACLNQSLSKDTAMEIIMSIVFNKQAMDATLTNFMNQLNELHWDLLDGIFQNIKKIMIVILNKVAEKSKSQAIITYFAATALINFLQQGSTKLTKGNMEFCIQSTLKIFGLCQQYDLLLPFAAQIGKWLGLSMLWLSVVSKCIMEIPASVLTGINWNQAAQALGLVIKRYYPEPIVKEYEDIWNQDGATIVTALENSRMLVSIYSKEFAQDMQNISSMSKLLYTVMAFYSNFLMIMYQFDNFEANTQTYLDFKVNLPVTLPKTDNSMSVVDKVITVIWFWWAFVRPAKDDGVTKYYKWAINAYPQLRSHGCLSD